MALPPLVALAEDSRGAVAGTVTVDGSDTPAPDVEVRLLFGLLSTVRRTDKDGRYVFEHLLPGKYSVRVVPPEGTRAAGDATVGLTVVEGAEPTPADFTLAPAGAPRVAGGPALTASPAARAAATEPAGASASTGAAAPSAPSAPAASPVSAVASAPAAARSGPSAPSAASTAAASAKVAATQAPTATPQGTPPPSPAPATPLPGASSPLPNAEATASTPQASAETALASEVPTPTDAPVAVASASPALAPSERASASASPTPNDATTLAATSPSATPAASAVAPTSSESAPSTSEEATALDAESGEAVATAPTSGIAATSTQATAATSTEAVAAARPVFLPPGSTGRTRDATPLAPVGVDPALAYVGATPSVLASAEQVARVVNEPPRRVIDSFAALRVGAEAGAVSLRAMTTGTSVLLPVPFRTQIDGTNFSLVNCGPASLSMVLAAFGLDVDPPSIRDYLNYRIGNYDTEQGTSLYVLANIAREAGLNTFGSSRGGLEGWTLDDVRRQVTAGNPVITLTKYRRLPGRAGAVTDFDHYVVITGLAGDDFIYNDGAYASDYGRNLIIGPDQLEQAWADSSNPRHAVAMGVGDEVRPLPTVPRRLLPEVATGATELVAMATDAAPRPTPTPRPVRPPALERLRDRLLEDLGARSTVGQ